MRNLTAVLVGVFCLGCGRGSPREGTALTADSVTIWYRVVGTGSETIIAPNALFLGGSLDDLAGSGRKLVTYDGRGRGRSAGVPLTKVGLERNFADLDAVASAVGAERFALIGWSGTGMEMFVYALRHPDRVSRLVQLAPIAPRAEPYGSAMMQSRAARSDTAALNALYGAADRGEYANRQPELCRRLAALDLAASLGDTGVVRNIPDVCDLPNEWPVNLWPYFGQLLGTFGNFDWRPELDRFPGPRLVVHGELDNTPLEGNREWIGESQAVRFEVIQGAGHWPHYERPQQTLRVIREFLDQT